MLQTYGAGCVDAERRSVPSRVHRADADIHGHPRAVAQGPLQPRWSGMFAVDRLHHLWDQEVAGSNPAVPTHGALRQAPVPPTRADGPGP